MTEERKSRFVVISNEEQHIKQEVESNVPQSSGYHSNPIYERLLSYKQLHEKKKFTVDDLLKWC